VDKAYPISKTREIEKSISSPRSAKKVTFGTQTNLNSTTSSIALKTADGFDNRGGDQKRTTVMCYIILG